MPRVISVATVGVLAIAVVGTAVAFVSKTPDPAHTSIRFVIDGRSIAERFPRGRSIVFRYPSNWHVTTRRLDDVLDPHTVFAVSTYELSPASRDHCDGTYARGRPNDGVFVLVKEVLDQGRLGEASRVSPRSRTTSGFQPAEGQDVWRHPASPTSFG